MDEDKPVTLTKGASYFGSGGYFSTIRYVILETPDRWKRLDLDAAKEFGFNPEFWDNGFASGWTIQVTQADLIRLGWLKVYDTAHDCIGRNGRDLSREVSA